MKIMLLLFAGLFISNCGISQDMSLKITTDQFVDSVYFSGKKCDLSRINDTIVQVKLDFSNVSGDEGEVALYSVKRIYKTLLSIPDIKSRLSTEFQNRGQITMTKNQCTVLTIDGHSVHYMGSLSVFESKKEKIIIKECCGVHLEK